MSYSRTSANTDNWTMNNATSNKMGVVKKCPNCGATVEMQMVRCPQCGYHFGGVEANSSAKRLAELLNLNSSKGRYKRSDIVVNFPVPTTKADLLEFMADLAYRAKHYEESGEYMMTSAFKAKYNECATKAHIFFGNDPDFQHLFEIEAKSKKFFNRKKFKRRNLSSDTKGLIALFSFFAFLVAILIIAANWKDIKNYFRENKAKTEITQFKEDYKDLSQQVKEQVDKGDLKQAEFILTQVALPTFDSSDKEKEATSFLDNAFVIVVQYYIDKGDIKSAKRIGQLLEGKVAFYRYDDTMTYKLLEKYKDDETSYNSQNSNSDETNEEYSNNQAAMQTEEIANQIQSQVEDYADEIRSQAEDYASQISSEIDN